MQAHGKLIDISLCVLLSIVFLVQLAKCSRIEVAPFAVLDDEVIQHLKSRGLSPPIMDRDQVERTRRHYDSHARPNLATSEALKQRNQGKSIQLKRFHNEVKRTLIEVYAGGCDRLLDLACGRGGDLDKWFSAGVREVVGVDLSGQELEEARRRLQEHEAKVANGSKRRPREYGNMCVEFFQSDQLGVSSIPQQFGSRPGTFGAVSCMFALHYFFETESSLRNMLRHVAAALEPGGYFFGVLVDGRKVNELLLDHDEFRNAYVRLKSEYRAAAYHQVGEFGLPYVFALQDTVTGEVEESSGSREFLTKEETLERVAAEFGLAPVRRIRDATLDRILSGCRADTIFKHFKPKYSGEDSRDLEAVSALNAAFVFVKKQVLTAGEDGKSRSRGDGGDADAGRGSPVKGGALAKKRNWDEMGAQGGGKDESDRMESVRDIDADSTISSL